MSFVSPLVLYGLFALAIPVIIHLINLRRYRKVYFTNVRFLSEIKQEKQKRSQLRQWILLAVRLLTIASLVFAFAQPYLPSTFRSDQRHQQGICLYVDNSFSMDAIGSEGKLIETAKEKAREVVSTYKPSDRFQLLTNDFEGAHQHFLSRDEFLAQLQEVQLSPSGRNLSEVIRRQKDLLDAHPLLSGNIFLISDFQKATSDFDHLDPDTVTSYFLLPLSPNQSGNLYIDTAYFDAKVQQPGQLSNLHVRIKNTGDSRLEKIPVKLVINQRQKALASTELDPGSEIELILPYTNESGEIQTGYIEIPDFPVVFDDKCFLSYPLITSLSVLAINDTEENPYLNALYGHDSLFHFINASANHLNYSTFSSFSLIILNQLHHISSGLAQELVRFLHHGGTVVMIPPREAELSDYREICSLLGVPEMEPMDTSILRVSAIMAESQLYRDVFEPNALGKVEIPANADLPKVHAHYPLRVSANTELEPLLLLQNGDLLLARKAVGKGELYWLTTPLDPICSSFPGHLLFVPTFYNIALFSQPRSNLYYFTGSNDPIEAPVDSLPDGQIYRILKQDGTKEVIPEIRFIDGRILLYPYDQIMEAGLYEIKLEDKPMKGLAFNYPRSESDLTCMPAEAIREILQRKGIRSFMLLQTNHPSMEKEIREAELGKPLWKLFLLLGLLFLGVEIAIIRFFPKQ